MILTTERLLLRHWAESDAEDLYEWARDPAVGPPAGWPPHKSLDDSREILRHVLMKDNNFAVCLKESGRAIGSISLRLQGTSDLATGEDECELGYWLAKPYWGQGLMTEAAREAIRYGFEGLNMNKIWCGYYDGNERSRRVQEKCGFRYQWTTPDLDVPQMNEKRTGHVNLLTRAEYEAGLKQ